MKNNIGTKTIIDCMYECYSIQDIEAEAKIDEGD